VEPWPLVYGGRESAEITEGMVMVSRGISVRDIPFPLLDPTSGMVLDGGMCGNSHADERRLCSGLGSISKSLPESRRIANLVAFFRRLAMKRSANIMRASPNNDPRTAPTITETLLEELLLGMEAQEVEGDARPDELLSVVDAPETKGDGLALVGYRAEEEELRSPAQKGSKSIY